MGKAIVGVAIVVVFILFCAWLIWMDDAEERAERREKRRQSRHNLAVREALLEQAEDHYRQLQQAVRLLERIKDRDEDEMLGVLLESHRSQAELIIRRFYRDTPGGEIGEGKGT